MIFKREIFLIQILLLILIKNGLFQQQNYNFTYEERLFELLFNKSNYNKNMRPDSIVGVGVIVSLKQIISIDEKNQIMSSSGYFGQYWNDKRLIWNRTHYGNVSLLIIPTKVLWIPDTIILNTADQDGFLKISDNSYSIVFSNGLVVLLLPSFLTRTRCNLYMKSFPFDEQSCDIILTSWSYPNTYVSYEVRSSLIDLEGYVENQIWKLKNISIKSPKPLSILNTESNSRNRILVQIDLARKSLYYIINGVFPCIVLDIVTLMTFLFPYAQQLTISRICTNFFYFY